MCNQSETELYFVSITEADGTVHLTTQEITAQDPETDLSAIPPEYHEFADLFSKKEADKLPCTSSMIIRSP